MKLRGILLLALFPFLHAQSYSAAYISCQKDEIILKSEDEKLQVSLFNTRITKKEGWAYVCDAIANSEDLHFEIDPSSKIEEPLPVYLFDGDSLLNERVIAQGYGYPMIHNPEYTYEKELEKAFDTTQTMAKPTKKAAVAKHAIVAPLYTLAVAIVWLSILVWWLYRRKTAKRGKR